MKHVTGLLAVLILLFDSVAIVTAEDFVLRTAVEEQMKKWRISFNTAQAARKCDRALIAVTEKYVLREDIIANWEVIENAAQLCEEERDAQTEGIFWLYIYLKLTADQKSRILNRRYLLKTIDRSVALLQKQDLEPILKADLTALETETALSSQELTKVIALADEAEALFEALGIHNSLSLSIAISNRAFAKYKQGNPELGIKELVLAEKMLHKLEKAERGQLAIIHWRLAEIYGSTQKPLLSIEHIEKTRIIVEEFGAKIQAADLCYNKGIELLDLGLYDTAIDAFTEAKNIYLKNGLERQLGGALFNLGKAWYGKSNIDRSLNFYLQAERILSAQEDHVGLSKVFVSQGILYENLMTMESYGKAEKYYEKAENLIKKYSPTPGKDLIPLAINKGKLYERWGKYDEALQAYRSTEQYLPEVRSTARYIIYNNLASIYLLRNEYDKALDYAQKSIADLEKVLEMGFCIGGESNLDYRDKHLSSYSIAVKALVQKGQLKEAYAMREMSRNRMFQMMVRMKGDGLNEKEVDSLWGQKIQLDNAISKLDRIAVNDQSVGGRTKLVLQRSNLKKELLSVENKLFKNPDLYRKLFNKESLDIDKLQSVLRHNEALIDYQIQFEAVLNNIQTVVSAFVINRDGIKHVLLTQERDTNTFMELIHDYNDLHTPQTYQKYYSQGLSGEYKDVIESDAKRLYDELFGALAKELTGISRLFIIPDGPLNRLPFETLRDPQGTLLLDRYSISYLSSATDLYTSTSKENNGFLAYGDIDYGAALKGNHRWYSIPGSAETLSAIIGYVKNKVPVTYIHSGEATETRFKSVCGNYKIILLWSHGEFNDYNQMPAILKTAQDKKGLTFKTVEELDAYYQYLHARQFNDPLSNSFVVLAGVNNGGDGLNDGYLTAREVMNLNLQGTELTILAACETGLGRTSQTEGVLGLRKAFTLAGSKQILISLWQVDARWTGELIKLMIGNYDKLGGAHALRDAKKTIIRELHDEGIEPYPFYWAGFILVGGQF